MSDDFKVPVSDSQGHSVNQYFRCLPGHERQIVKIVSSQRFPYRTKGDLLRHALKRHLDFLEDLQGDEEIPSVTRQVDAILEILHDDEYFAEFRFAMEKLKERVAKHVADGSDPEARRLILDVIAKVHRMPSGFWRNKYLDTIKLEFGKFINGGKMKLGNLTPEEEENDDQ